MIKIDLSAVNVTCIGATAPIELLFNLLIISICTIIIESNFQVLRIVTFNSMMDAFI